MKNQKSIMELAADETYSIFRRNGINGKLDPHTVTPIKEKDKPLLEKDISAERILILRNGFNRDLGLLVDYTNFFESSQWSDYFQEYENAPIVKYIESQRFKYNQNIEVILKSYVDSLNNSSNSGIDKNAFEQLELAFSNFVREQTCEKITIMKAYTFIHFATLLLLT